MQSLEAVQYKYSRSVRRDKQNKTLHKSTRSNVPELPGMTFDGSRVTQDADSAEDRKAAALTRSKLGQSAAIIGA